MELARKKAKANDLVLFLSLLCLQLFGLPVAVAAEQNITQNKQEISSRGSHTDCGANYAPVHESQIHLSLYHLIGPKSQAGRLGKRFGQGNDAELGLDELNFERFNYDASLDELKLSKLNPSLPFEIFVNGFNHQGDFNGTWMRNVASVFHRRFKMSAGWESSNVVFFSWHISGIHATNAVSIIPAYYKTVANYDIILDRFESCLMGLIGFIEQSNDWRSEKSRREFYGKFAFYGHSLGSHLIADTIELASKRQRPLVKFGKLVGLDPAVPCFANQSHGISAIKTAAALNQLTIVHSNAGLAGQFSERSPIEIVLNGGTFQPNCSWYDLSCHHTRSTDILTYIDERCQMVAYKCSSYEQFKLGACGICEQSNDASPTDGFVLVNLAQQHWAGQTANPYLAFEPVRQLADPGDILMQQSSDQPNLQERPTSANSSGESVRDHAKAFYHYVNTNPHFGLDQDSSHCLQHYQTRLLILTDQQSDATNCPLKMHLSAGLERIQVELESGAEFSDDRMAKVGADPQKLNPIIEDKLYTGLVNFAGEPQLFTGANLSGIDLRKWSRCLGQNRNESSRGELRFVLDVAFMSHTSQSVRHKYSSVLCGQWNPFEDLSGKSDKMLLTLGLCKRAELVGVGEKIDLFLKEIKFHNQYNSWKVSLLNSLFSLYSKWEPFRRQASAN